MAIAKTDDALADSRTRPRLRSVVSPSTLHGLFSPSPDRTEQIDTHISLTFASSRLCVSPSPPYPVPVSIRYDPGCDGGKPLMSEAEDAANSIPSSDDHARRLVRGVLYGDLDGCAALTTWGEPISRYIPRVFNDIDPNFLFSDHRLSRFSRHGGVGVGRSIRGIPEHIPIVTTARKPTIENGWRTRPPCRRGSKRGFEESVG